MNDDENKDTGHVESHGSAEVGDKQLFNPTEDNRSEVQVHADTSDDSMVTWEASEYINHQKSPTWYLALTGATLVLGAVLYLLLRDIWSLVVLLVMYAAITVYARREPRVLRYSVSTEGVSIGERHFTYDQFKSFSVMQETGVPSISLDPTQRFMPAVSVYFAPEDGDKIVGQLAKFLPQEQKVSSAVDRAMTRLRF